MLRLLLMILVVAAVGIALVSSWDDVGPYLGAISPGPLVLALLLALLAPYLTMLGWRTMLADLGSPLPQAPAAGVFFVGQLGKYIPGSIWAIIAQAEMGSRLGVPRRRVGVVGLLAIALALLTAGVIGLPALPVLLGRTEAGGYAVLLVVVLLAIACYPPFVNAAVRRGLRLLRRQPLEHDLGGRSIVTTLLWFSFAWLVSGSAVLVVATNVAGLELTRQSLLMGICGFALSSAFGMISVLFPAGFGVRDGMLALVLATSMPLPAAAAVAVVIRFLTVTVDVVVAAGGWAWARSNLLLDTGGRHPAGGVVAPGEGRSGT